MQAGAFISLADAEHLTGVSAATLTRFAEAGYFSTKPLEGTEVGFELEKNELCALFKIVEKPNAKTVAPPAQSIIKQPSADTENLSKASLTQDIEVSSQDNTESILVEPAASPLAEHIESQVNAPSATNPETQKLRALCELHEKYIEFKESQIQALTEERNWLRTRIEKLEEKSERDQMILASMSETQRGLTSQIMHKKSAIQAALEWFGVTLPEPQRDDSRL